MVNTWENLHWGGGVFDRIPIRKSFYLSYFLFANSILHMEMFHGNFFGEIFNGLGFPV